ncbi:hypothetical protein L6164_036682 [Bauhinia variegata]|uniref:Uncharacterized protein n=1 Tax=Bauhinia variegata TaxID=167791 RepID=A0ACB9KHP7_BAUVA|nr:hypothetical protein L6164_036682 [Bauhinia variegata]
MWWDEVVCSHWKAKESGGKNSIRTQTEIKEKEVCGERGSNTRPPDLQSGALPTELSPQMHQPGIEPGSVPWQGTILPLDHWCLMSADAEL